MWAQIGYFLNPRMHSARPRYDAVFFFDQNCADQEMEAYCEKYRQRLSGKDLKCGHPLEYCKFRTSCIAHFLGKESADDENEKTSQVDESNQQAMSDALKRSTDEATGL